MQAQLLLIFADALRNAVILIVAFGFTVSTEWWGSDLQYVVLWNGFSALAVIVMWIGVARRDLQDRASWVMAAAGLTAWVIGDAVWAWADWHQGLPTVSVVDLLYLLGFAAFLVAIGLLISNRTGPLPKDAVLDGAILAATSSLLLWAVVVAPSTWSGSFIYRSINISYPVLSLVLLLGAVWVMMHPSRPTLPHALTVLSVALAVLSIVWLISAWHWLYWWASDGFMSFVDRCFQAAFALLAIAPFLAGSGDRRRDPTGLHPMRVVFLGAALMAGPAILVADESFRTESIIISTTVSVLILARFLALSRTREQARAELAHQATHDALTGLGNRTLLFDSLTEVAHRAAQHGTGVALLWLDVDKFKSINDSYGHAAGDALLVELSERLRQCLREGDLAARLGGDEFVVLLDGIDSVEDARIVAERLHDLVAAPFAVDATLTIAATVSIGIAATLNGPFDITSLQRQADTALYHVKRNGRHATAIYDPAMTTATAMSNEVVSAGVANIPRHSQTVSQL